LKYTRFSAIPRAEARDVRLAELVEHGRPDHPHGAAHPAEKGGQEGQENVVRVTEHKPGGRFRKREAGIPGHREKSGARGEELQQDEHENPGECVMW